MTNFQPLFDECRRPFDLDLKDLQGTIRLLESELSKTHREKMELLLRIDQLKWDNDNLKERLEMHALDDYHRNQTCQD